ncbi:hypothetical protein KCU61_g792, partial [Aureobasidium melanogenum]
MRRCHLSAKHLFRESAKDVLMQTELNNETRNYTDRCTESVFMSKHVNHLSSLEGVDAYLIVNRMENNSGMNKNLARISCMEASR